MSAVRNIVRGPDRRKRRSKGGYAGTGFATREMWLAHKRDHGIITDAEWRELTKVRTEDKILADAARMLADQLAAQKARWGFV